MNTSSPGETPKTRYRIFFANSETLKRCPTVTHWIFAADWIKHSWLHYAHSYFAVHTDGKAIEGYQLHKEFRKP